MSGQQSLVHHCSAIAESTKKRCKRLARHQEVRIAGEWFCRLHLNGAQAAVDTSTIVEEEKKDEAPVTTLDDEEQKADEEPQEDLPVEEEEGTSEEEGAPTYYVTSSENENAEFEAAHNYP